MKITTEAQAKKSAETKHNEIGLAEKYSTIRRKPGKYIVKEFAIGRESAKHEFPFFKLRDGDAVITDNAVCYEVVFFYKDKYYGSYDEKANGFDIEYKERIPIEKTGFNILDYLESTKNETT